MVTSSGTQGGAVSLTDCLVSFLVGLAFTGAGGGKTALTGAGGGKKEGGSSFTEAGGGKREGGSSCSSSREGCSREEVEAEK